MRLQGASPGNTSIITNAGFPDCVLNFIKGSLTKVKVSPCFGNTVFDFIDIFRGVKQGCPLSPLIFILAYDPLLVALAALPGVKPFAFADDLAMAARDVTTNYY